MCKLLMLAGIDKSKVAKAWTFVKSSTEFMSEYDHDGLGYAAMSGNELFGERWLDNKQAFLKRNELDERDKHMKDWFKDAISVESNYNSFGDLALMDQANAIMLHTRMATCGKGLENTHPFVSEGTALIHNGVIRNSGKLVNITSTCDSETILNEYLSCGVENNPDYIQSVVDSLQGYYACGVLGTNIGRGYMDVFKDDTARLVLCYVPELGCYVFCTNEMILKNTAKACSMTVTNMHEVCPGNLIRLDVVTGKPMAIERFITTPTASYMSKANAWEYTNDDAPETEDDIENEIDLRIKSHLERS